MASGKFDHIIWDWNGTLLNDAWLCVEVMNQMLSERELPQISVDIYRNLFTFPVRDYYLELGYDFEKESFEKVGMEFMVLYNQRQREGELHRGVYGLLSEIAKRKYTQSILSAREQNELRLETSECGVDHFFQLIYGLDDHYAHGKTAVGLKLIKDLAIPREKLLFIGDTSHDAEVADEMGIHCMLIPNGHQSKERLEKCNHPLLDSLQELLNFL